jgi:hypothetical protein
VKYSDGVNSRLPNRKSYDSSGDVAGLAANPVEFAEPGLPGETFDSPPSARYQRYPSTAETSNDEVAYYPGVAKEREYAKFQDRVRQGKVKNCSSCGGVMTRSSRMILSGIAGLTLMVLGAVFLTVYGLATSFYQAPWFLKFLLPASYYLGSIFIGVGILFFFIREKVWYCSRCKEIAKR